MGHALPQRVDPEGVCIASGEPRTTDVPVAAQPNGESVPKAGMSAAFDPITECKLATPHRALRDLHPIASGPSCCTGGQSLSLTLGGNRLLLHRDGQVPQECVRACPAHEHHWNRAEGSVQHRAMPVGHCPSAGKPMRGCYTLERAVD